MISVVERLIESWLDSQAERRYQPAFIQLLVSEGWNVLHNTRHSPIELGKDVIARSPDGTLHCFQLKGNPGSRITKTEAQTILPQLIELLELPLSKVYRLNARERHIAVFVTNGEIDEEARLVFETVGQRAGADLCPAQDFELWTRGVLVARFLKTAGRVWPTSLEDTRQAIEFMGRDGRAIPDPKAVSRLLASTAPVPSRPSSNAAKTAKIAALLLLAEIVKSPWYATENHYVLHMMTVLASVQALRFADSTKRIAMVTRYASLCLEHCADLVNEAQMRHFDPDLVWGQGDVLAEFDTMWERRRLVGDCAATLVLSGGVDVRYDESYAATLRADPRSWESRSTS